MQVGIFITDRVIGRDHCRILVPRETGNELDFRGQSLFHVQTRAPSPPAVLGLRANKNRSKIMGTRNDCGTVIGTKL